MRKLLLVMTFIMAFLPIANAQLDAVFIVKSKEGKVLQMRDENGNIIYGDVVVNKYVLFDASSSNDFYGGINGIEEFWWDWDGDGKWDIKHYDSPYIWHSFDKPGIYNVTLMIVDKNAPGGPYSDVVSRPVKVVEKLLPPVIKLNIEKVFKKGMVECIFNATRSHDPNGYIKTFEWDLDGDGVYEKKGGMIAIHNYTSNGYYVIHLRVTNWDLIFNTTTRVIKIDELNGTLNSIEKNVTFVNHGKEKIVNIVVNNDEEFQLQINKKKTVKLSLNRGINEIDLKYDGIQKIIIFDASEIPPIEIGEKGSNHTPFPGFPFLLLAFIIVIALKINNRPF